MSFNFIVPQSPAGAVPALYYVPPNVLQYQQPPPTPNPATVVAYRQFFGKTPPAPFLHPKFKTELCNKYNSKYGCPYGEQCQFRHPEDPAPQEAAMISQMTISEGTNSVSSNNSFGSTMVNRTSRYVGRSQAESNGLGRGVSQGKPLAFRSQFNNRQGKTQSAQPTAFIHPKFKTEFCNKYNSKNGCPYGEQCQFRHPEDPVIQDAVISRVSQMAISEGTNSVSSNNSLGISMVNRTNRYVRRNHIGSSGDGREVSQGKSPMFCSQFNNRQGAVLNSPTVRNANKVFVNKSGNVNNGTVGINLKPFHRQFFNEKTLPNFMKFASKVPKNGMRRYNSSETIGTFTFTQISTFKKIYH